MELTCLRMACCRFVDGPLLASVACNCPNLEGLCAVAKSVVLKLLGVNLSVNFLSVYCCLCWVLVVVVLGSWWWWYWWCFDAVGVSSSSAGSQYW